MPQLVLTEELCSLIEVPGSKHSTVERLLKIEAVKCREKQQKEEKKISLKLCLFLNIRHAEPLPTFFRVC